MAPSNIYEGPHGLTRVDLTSTVCANSSMSYGYSNCHYLPIRKQETKRERIARVAKEKMLASWYTFNDKTPTIKIITQLCKPQNKLIKR